MILSDTACRVPDRGIPFIALSDDASIDSAVRAVRNGAQDFLTKPIDMNHLLQSIQQALDNPPAPAALRQLRNAAAEHARHRPDGLSAFRPRSNTSASSSTRSPPARPAY